MASLLTVLLLQYTSVPSNVNPPYKISTTSSSIIVGWNEPKANGCPIIRFAIYRDNAANDAITNEVDSASKEQTFIKIILDYSTWSNIVYLQD
jgi:hypothetical protein